MFKWEVIRQSDVLQLPEGGGFEALHCPQSTDFDRSKKLALTTEPPLLGRCCYVRFIYMIERRLHNFLA